MQRLDDVETRLSTIEDMLRQLLAAAGIKSENQPGGEPEPGSDEDDDSDGTDSDGESEAVA